MQGQIKGKVAIVVRGQAVPKVYKKGQSVPRGVIVNVEGRKKARL